MLKDMTPRERKYETQYEIRFFYDKTGGFAFPCDENGKIFKDDLTDAAKENYLWCLEHPEKFQYYNKLTSWERRYTEPATGICKCGHRIELYDQYLGACECPHCGQWYSLSGQELLPPKDWGWDGTPMDDDY